MNKKQAEEISNELNNWFNYFDIDLCSEFKFTQYIYVYYLIVCDGKPKKKQLGTFGDTRTLDYITTRISEIMCDHNIKQGDNCSYKDYIIHLRESKINKIIDD
jgi:hypothetical protein